MTFISNASFDVGDQWSKIQEALGAGKTVFELAQRTPELKEPSSVAASGDTSQPRAETDTETETSHADATIADASNAISFSNVHFAYPTRPTATVLDGLDLELQPGTMVGIVGGSGSGKSTLLKLLCRFYEPSQRG